MIQTDITLKPRLTFLTDEDKQRVKDAAFQVLSEVGMRLYQKEALDLLKTAGCRIEADDLVKIPPELVEKALKSAPSNIPVYNREGVHVMDLGGRRSYYGTGSDLIYSFDAKTGKRHQCLLEDVKHAARVCDALKNIDFIMSFAHPNDHEAQRAYLVSFQAMVQHCVKPIVCTAEGRDDLSEMWEIARILRGGEDKLREKPYFIQYAEPISPLKHPVDSIDKLLFCAEKAIPVIYSPAPIAGSTAPMTIAGHLVQGLAESFFGLTVHQLKAPGAPFLMGMGAAVLDMATSQCSYNAPEYYMAYLAMVEMSQFFDLPNWGYAGTSDSQIPDGQAVLEAGLLTFLSEMAGSNLNHDVGYLDFGLTGSLEMIVICDEIIDQVRRMARGIPVTEDTMAVKAIAEVGHAGHYLTHPHTLKHLRSVQWRPKLVNRQGFEQWQQQGSTSLMQRARKRLEEILDNHTPAALNPEKERAIQDRVTRFKG